jgi:hypothetical protein
MKRGMNRRAVTNVEMVVAIVIFVFTIFSMLVLFNVFHKADNKSNSLDAFEQNFLESAGNYTLVEEYCGPEAHYKYTFSFELSPFFPTGECSSTVVYSIPTTGKIFSYAQLAEMNQRYSTDYDTLKAEFGSDFILSIKYENGTSMFSMVRTKPSGSEIYAKNFRIKVYDEVNAKIINALVNVQTW